MTDKVAEATYAKPRAGRIGALEAGAAIAVIITCITAMGLMTGVLPPLTERSSSVAAMPGLPPPPATRESGLVLGTSHTITVGQVPVSTTLPDNPPATLSALVTNAEAGQTAGRRSAVIATGNHRHGGARPAGKTRKEVKAELMQAKRDGTYPADAELYR